MRYIVETASVRKCEKIQIDSTTEGEDRKV